MGCLLHAMFKTLQSGNAQYPAECAGALARNLHDKGLAVRAISGQAQGRFQLNNRVTARRYINKVQQNVVLTL